MRSMHRSDWADLLLLAALIFGAFVRFNPSLSSDFVIKQGGMFAVMIDDLRENHYLIPEYTSYNGLNIPYAYPPVGFYSGAIVADLLGLSSNQVLRWLPALFASLSVLAFYYLAGRLMKDKYHAAVATLFFSLLPRAFSWFVTGSGLTRSPGQLFMLLTLAAVVRVYQEKRQRDLFWAGVFGGLTVMSHPEAALHAAVSAVFLWIMLSRSRAGFVNSVGIALIVLLVAAPWWVTVIYQHGAAPLLSAVQTGQKSSAILNLLFFSFTEEPYSTLIAVLGLVGLAYSILHKEYLLPLWLVLPFIVEGRSAAGPAAIPLALLAAIGLLDVILPSLLTIHPKNLQQLDDKVPAIEFSLLVYVVLYGVFSAYQFGLQLSNTSVLSSDREAMSWIRKNTPENARFLVLTGTSSVSCDSTLEWFPALTDRQSLFTVQGTEWTKGSSFGAFVTSTYAVQKCLSADHISCLDAAVDRSQYEYIYLTKRFNPCSLLDAQLRFPLFLESIEADSRFAAVYETAEIVVFENLAPD